MYKSFHFSIIHLLVAILFYALPLAGSASSTSDVSIIGDFVWEDTNGNGVQDKKEPGLSQVVVELQTCAGKKLQSMTTNQRGRFTFKLRSAGRYRLKFHLPNSYRFSPEQSAGNFQKDSNANLKTGLTRCYSMHAGLQRAAIDAGMIPLSQGQIGDYVWNDSNADGVQDDDEEGLQNIAVDLLRCNGDYLATTTTNHRGRFVFDNLAAGRYKLKFNLPNEYIFSALDVSFDGITMC